MTPVNLLLYVLLAAVLVLIALIIRQEIRLRKLLAGKNATNLEETIHNLIEATRTLFEEKEHQAKRLQSLEKRADKSIREIKTVRFNPFLDQGGNQSFATALINDEGDGVIISSLYARDRMSVFAKPILKHASEHELTEEEKEVLEKARIK